MFYENQVFTFFKLLDYMMQFEEYILFTVSLNVNLCVVIFCVCVRVQSHINRKCCCRRNSFYVVICHAFAETPSDLAKTLTEQITLWLLCMLSVIAVCICGLWYSPFHGSVNQNYMMFIQIVLASFVGRYIYMIAQNIYLLRKSNFIRFRVDVIHHVTTIICCGVFIFNKENLLLSLIGITMELNTSVIAYAKMKKKSGQSNTESYKRLTIFSCTVTIAFRCVIPLVFLVVSMFRETPFGMSYVSVTVFFISLIFFSVINVWLVLTNIQRLIKTYSSNGLLSNEPKTYHRNVPLPGGFEKNNLGYMRSYANRNLSSKEDEKINTAKKEFIKNNLNTTVTNALIRPSNLSQRLDSSLNNATGSTSVENFRQLSMFVQGTGHPDLTRTRGHSEGDIRIHGNNDTDSVDGNIRQLNSESDVYRLRASDSSNSSYSSASRLELNLHGHAQYTPH